MKDVGSLQNVETVLLALISVSLCMGISSVALMLGFSVATAKSAQELVPLVVVPQILFTGIFVSINFIPRCLRWIEYGCAHCTSQYSFREWSTSKVYITTSSE